VLLRRGLRLSRIRKGEEKRELVRYRKSFIQNSYGKRKHLEKRKGKRG